MSASKWADFECYGLDFESTGVDVTEARIVQAAWVHIRPARRPVTRTWLVDPGIEIPDEAAAVHGITTAHAREHGTDPGQMLFELTGLVAMALGHGFPVVAFNASYDFSLLEHENHRHGIDGLVSRLVPGGVQPVVDPFVLDRFADPYRKGKRQLVPMCAAYGVTHTGAHDAAADALAACRLWPRIMAKHSRRFPGMTLPALHQSQVGWRRAQCDSLRAYFDKQGTSHDGIDPSWPLLSSVRSLPTAVA